MQKQMNSWFLGIAVVLSFIPILMFQGKEFKATDGKNVTEIEAANPNYKPWFSPVIKPSGGEIETFLFSAQAAIGSGVTCYILGLYKGRTERRKSNETISGTEHRD
jgi:cobalt/nickel transport protein